MMPFNLVLVVKLVMHTLVQKMLELQDSMNCKVHEDWRQQNFDWYRAIWVECAELMDHYGWKWWKKQEPDMEQVKLELIDIWHFGLSHLMQDNTENEELAWQITHDLKSASANGDFKLALESFTQWTLNNRGFSVAEFANLMAVANLSFDALYAGYIGKNVLNFFRQDHGYKQGTYIKEWGGREDNEHLVEVSASLDSSSPVFQSELYDGLKSRYEKLIT